MPEYHALKEKNRRSQDGFMLLCLGKQSDGTVWRLCAESHQKGLVFAYSTAFLFNSLTDISA
jgi:hypothetical protein